MTKRMNFCCKWLQAAKLFFQPSEHVMLVLNTVHEY